MMGRSPTSWAGAHFRADDIAINTKVLLGSFAPTGVGGPHVTPIRIVGNLSTEHAVGTGGTMVVGAAVFADAAVAAGIASLPDPLTDASDDIWTFIRGIPYPDAATRRVSEFDSRAARKVEEGQQLVFIVANSTTGNVSTINFFVRVLTKTGIRS